MHPHHTPSPHTLTTHSHHGNCIHSSCYLSYIGGPRTYRRPWATSKCCVRPHFNFASHFYQVHNSPSFPPPPPPPTQKGPVGIKGVKGNRGPKGDRGPRGVRVRMHAATNGFKSHDLFFQPTWSFLFLHTRVQLVRMVLLVKWDPTGQGCVFLLLPW